MTVMNVAHAGLAFQPGQAVVRRIRGKKVGIVTSVKGCKVTVKYGPKRYVPVPSSALRLATKGEQYKNNVPAVSIKASLNVTPIAVAKSKPYLAPFTISAGFSVSAAGNGGWVVFSEGHIIGAFSNKFDLKEALNSLF